MAQLNKQYQVLNLLIEKYGCKIQFSSLTMEVLMYSIVHMYKYRDDYNSQTPC